MDRSEMFDRNLVISIPLRSITLTRFPIFSFVKLYADLYRKSIRLLTTDNI
ncbi:MAG: hypothetical protein GTN68_39205 [Candidatus Aminicenantes bacterium]|nr:hypothetical protein [Candidatus Aminicenantes bacterium]